MNRVQSQPRLSLGLCAIGGRAQRRERGLEGRRKKQEEEEEEEERRSLKLYVSSKETSIILVVFAGAGCCHRLCTGS